MEGEAWDALEWTEKNFGRIAHGTSSHMPYFIYKKDLFRRRRSKPMARDIWSATASQRRTCAGESSMFIHLHVRKTLGNFHRLRRPYAHCKRTIAAYALRRVR